MRVSFDPAARDELDRITAWIAKDNPRAALALLERIEAKVNQLAMPELVHMGRPGTVQGTRELIERPYIIIYKVFEDFGEVVVLSIVHGAQRT
jgi:toxin ParE1/3/4